MSALPAHLTIGELAARSGVATSALRYYESQGLISAERTESNHRTFPRATLRRVATIRAAQTVGLSLAQIKEALDTLPRGRTPTKTDWEKLSRRWSEGIEERIAELERLKNDLTGCIGCGCLSLETCALLNRDDHAADKGAGARYLLGDPRPDR